MPRTQFQKLFFAFVTVIITVHAYVYYSLYVIHGNTFIANTGASGVLEAIDKIGMDLWIIDNSEGLFMYK